MTILDQPLDRRLAIVGGLGIAFVAIATRIPQLSESLWLDELHSSWCVAGSWSDVVPRARIGNQSPLFFFILRLAVGIGGLSEVVLRLPSCIAGCGLTAVAGYATARWTGSASAGYLAASLIAVDRNCIFYSQEARPYALLQFVAWSHALVVWELSQKSTVSRRALFVVGAILQFYLHYTAILFLLAETVFFIDGMLHRRFPEGYRWKSFAIDASIICAAAVPAAGHLSEISARRQQWAVIVKQQPGLQDFWHTMRLEVYLFPTLGFLAAAYLLTRRLNTDPKSRPGVTRRRNELVASLLLVPSVLAWVATRRQIAALLLTRYLASSLVAAPVASAVLNRFLPTVWLRVAAAAVTLAASIAYSGMINQWRHDHRLIGDRRQDWRRAVELVNRLANSDHGLCFVRSGFVEETALGTEHAPLLDEYCLAPVNNIYKLKAKAIPLPSLSTEAANEIWERSREAQEQWLMINSRTESNQRFLDALEKVYRQRGTRIAFIERETFGTVQVTKLVKVPGRAKGQN